MQKQPEADGLALHNYHDVYHTFPPRANTNWCLDWVSNKCGNFRSIQVRLLPFFEQTARHEVRPDLYDISGFWATDGSDEIATAQIPVLRCPSDVSAQDWFGWLEKTNYAGNWGVGPLAWHPDPNCAVRDSHDLVCDSGGRRRGMFNWNVTTSIADISDGTSNTAAIAEIRRYDDQMYMRGHWSGIQGMEYVHTFPPNTSAPDLIRATGSQPSGAWCVDDPQRGMPCGPAAFSSIPPRDNCG